MYKKQSGQLSFEDFDQPMGLHMNPNNRWIKKAEMIPWAELEPLYANLFRNKKGNVAKPFRMAFGALIIQTEFDFSDEETVAQIQENPYLQFFIGLPGYQEEKPFDSSTMVYFRKRLSPEILQEINEKILAYHESLVEEDSSDDDDDDSSSNNKGTLMLDATCAPSNVKYPQDVDLLNDARKHTENLIDELCQTHKLKKPRTNRKQAREDYLVYAKRKKRPRKFRRQQMKKQLSYVTRNMKSIDRFLEKGIQLTTAQQKDYETIQKIMTQQKYMLDQNVDSVPNRIISYHQPFLRPIVRGKAKTPTEFGPKIDLSQSNGFVRMERVSFDAFNESTDLPSAVERYYERTGYYPKRVLVDQIYRTKDNLNYCKDRGIRVSGPKLGRPKKNPDPQEKVIAYQDEVDRIQIEREISLAKRKHGLSLIRAKLAETTLSVVHLSIISLNLSKIQRDSLRFILRIFSNLPFSKKFGRFFSVSF